MGLWSKLLLDSAEDMRLLWQVCFKWEMHLVVGVQHCVVVALCTPLIGQWKGTQHFPSPFKGMMQLPSLSGSYLYSLRSTDFGLVLFLLTLRWTLRSIFLPVDLPLDLSSFTTLHFRNSLAKDLFPIGLIQNTDIDKDVIKAIIWIKLYSHLL